jgi:hypothetical protein
MDVSGMHVLAMPPSGSLGAAAPQMDLAAHVHEDEGKITHVYRGSFEAEGSASAEVLRMRGSTQRARMATAQDGVSGDATADSFCSGSYRTDPSDRNSAQSLAAHSMLQALSELAALLRREGAAAVADRRNSTHIKQSMQDNNQDCNHALAKVGQLPGVVHALALGCTPSVGSTNSGPFGGNNQGVSSGGLAGKASKGTTWRGMRDVTDSVLMHQVHGHCESAAAESRCLSMRSVEGDKVFKESTRIEDVHTDDIDEIDETNTQLSGRSGSWLCLPAPPPLVYLEQASDAQHGRQAGIVTGSMHVSASTFLGADLENQSGANCGTAGSWLAAFTGKGCAARESILQKNGQAPRNGSLASQSEIAV